jgi:hypothetical protein
MFLRRGCLHASRVGERRIAEETPEALERAAAEIVRLLKEHAPDSVVAEMAALANKYMARAEELRVARGEKPDHDQARVRRV